MRQLEKPPKVKAISLEIDPTSNWAMKTEMPILDNSPSWLDGEDDQEKRRKH
jgi:hypothetical protein